MSDSADPPPTDEQIKLIARTARLVGPQTASDDPPTDQAGDLPAGRPGDLAASVVAILAAAWQQRREESTKAELLEKSGVTYRAALAWDLAGGAGWIAANESTGKGFRITADGSKAWRSIAKAAGVDS